MSSTRDNTIEERPIIEKVVVTGEDFRKMMRFGDITARTLAEFIRKKVEVTAKGRTTRGKIATTADGIWKMQRDRARRSVKTRYLRMLWALIGEESFWYCYDRAMIERQKAEEIAKLRQQSLQGGLTRSRR